MGLQHIQEWLCLWWNECREMSNIVSYQSKQNQNCHAKHEMVWENNEEWMNEWNRNRS